MARVVRRTFGTLRRNFLTFALLGLVLSVAPRALFAALGGYLGRSAPWLDEVTVFVVLLVGWLLQAAIICGVAADLGGGRASFTGSVSAVVRRLLPLVGLAVVLTIALCLSAMFLVLPAVLLTVLWAVAVPALVVEGRGVFASLGRSRKLTKGHRWAVLGLALVFLLFGFLAMMLTAFGGAFVFALLGDVVSQPLYNYTIGPVMFMVMGVVTSAAIGTIYHELKTAKEGAGAEALAAAFD